jgi:hypothetical protein
MNANAEPPPGVVVVVLAPNGHTWTRHPDGWRCDCGTDTVWTWDDVLEDAADSPYKITKPHANPDGG